MTKASDKFEFVKVTWCGMDVSCSQVTIGGVPLPGVMVHVADVERTTEDILAEKRKRKAIATFKRALRRHEKRARHLRGFEGGVVAEKLRALRLDPETFGYDDLREWTAYALMWRHRTGVFLFDRAENAVAKLRAALAETGGA